MKTKQLIFLLFILASLISCDDGHKIFEEYQSFGEKYEWKKSDVRTFVIDIKENKHPYQFSLGLRYVADYPYDKAMMKITETDPAGNKIMRDVEMKIRNEKGELLGEKGYDIVDLEMVLDENKEFPTFGKYTYEIEQAMPEIDPLVYVMEIGLVLRDQEKK